MMRPYTEWEDWQAGMYDLTSDEDAIHASFALLTSPSALVEAMRRAVEAWPVAAAQNLTDRAGNRRSWLGQAACCLVHAATEQSTCSAWWAMTASQQSAANAMADRVLREWEGRYAQTLFR